MFQSHCYIEILFPWFLYNNFLKKYKEEKLKNKFQKNKDKNKKNNVNKSSIEW